MHIIASITITIAIIIFVVVAIIVLLLMLIIISSKAVVQSSRPLNYVGLSSGTRGKVRDFRVVPAQGGEGLRVQGLGSVSKP